MNLNWAIGLAVAVVIVGLFYYMRRIKQGKTYLLYEKILFKK